MEQAHVTLFRDWRHSYYLFSSSSGSHLIYFPRQPPSQVQQLLQSPALSVKQGSGLARRRIFILTPLNVLPRRMSLRMRRKTRETIASLQLRPRPLLQSTRGLIVDNNRMRCGRNSGWSRSRRVFPLTLASRPCHSSIRVLTSSSVSATSLTMRISRIT